MIIMKEKDTCEIYCYNEEKVNRIQGELEKEDISGAAQLFKALAEENRAKIAYTLCQAEELCVCDIANIIGSSVANKSHHLRTLHKQKIVKYHNDINLDLYLMDYKIYCI